MSIADIEKKIMDEAQAIAREKSLKGKVELKRVLDEYAKKSKSSRDEIIYSGQRAVEDKQRSILTPVRLKAKTEVLLKKQEFIDRVFKQALESLVNLRDEDYKKLLAALYKKAGSYKNLQIIAPEGREKITQEALGMKDVESTDKIKGGFILKAEGLEINTSFSAIVNLVKREIEPKVIEILFKNA